MSWGRNMSDPNATPVIRGVLPDMGPAQAGQPSPTPLTTPGGTYSSGTWQIQNGANVSVPVPSGYVVK